MELDELLRLTNGKLTRSKVKKIKTFSFDSRNLKNGDCFIALKGKYKDGHDFINNNLKCSLIISEKNIENIKIPMLIVSSTRDALMKICLFLRRKYNIPLIAITGSNGKTTVKELIVSILKNKYNVLYNKDNNNNIFGVARTLFTLNKKHQIIVIEMGMNHKGELDEISKMCEPDTALITNIGSSHIGNLGSRKNIFKAKCEIKNYLKGDLIVNGDDKYLKKLKCFRCGCNFNNDLIAYNIHTFNSYITFDIYENGEYQFTYNKPVKDYITNLLLAIKIGMVYGIPIENIVTSISKFKCVDERLQLIKCNDYFIIDDCYNASYESVKCGLDYLKNINNDKLIILGDMLELSRFSKKYHKKIKKFLINSIDKS